MAKGVVFVEYIWLDGAFPTRFMRSKTKALQTPENPSIDDFPEWSFDGSSTQQAVGSDSDCVLKPVFFVRDTVTGRESSYLLLCEVLNIDGSPHQGDSRAILRNVLDAGASKLDAWIGFEQEYTFFKDRTPLGWPANGYPGPQGPYYCGVGADLIFGRQIVEEHAKACLDAEVMIYGFNAEVMPGQWEYQIGYRGIAEEENNVLAISDHLWIARWMLHYIAERHGINVNFENKPVKGDWNGSGMHTNFSTCYTRDPKEGKKALDQVIVALSKKHAEHIKVYGKDLADRLTGEHETCDINTFKVGDSDRGASVRIPVIVHQKGCGYFEDRRPGANADPYMIAARMCVTLADLDEKLIAAFLNRNH